VDKAFRKIPSGKVMLTVLSFASTAKLVRFDHHI
jgi:hypothetical protein